jgi:GTPase SAR1 family protein
MTLAGEPTLDEIGTQVRDAVPQPTAAQRRLFAQLDQQASRFRQSAFQLAVLGQFKRGKSTLLNALMGEALLSAGVLPLTAVPTFLSGSPALRLRLSYESGAVEERPVTSIEAMARDIAAATTEEENPHNVKGLRRVDVGVPGTPWLEEITLIDTPGTGSTHTHNTEAAYAVLPECDAALFVCSVDPPITEVELAYLGQIRRTVPRIIVILNKVDLVDSGDLRKASDFLSTIIADRAEAEIDRRVVPVSARQALTARRAGDQAALEASGLAELERYIRTELIGHKRDVLEQSITDKIAEIVAALAGDAAMTAKALSLPLADLDATVRAFDEAAIAFERERINLEDGLNGEWRRALSRLGALCEDLEQRARQQLALRLDGMSVSDQPDEGRSTVARIMNDVFEKEFAALASTVETELTASIDAHQQHYQILVARVRERAGALLNVPLPTALPSEWFQTRRQSYWVGERRVESISSLTADRLARLLPETLRRRRRQRKFREAVDRALTRNISDLHWTMRQNIDDSFRGLIAASREVVEASITSTRDLLATARRRLQEQDIRLHDELENARAVERRLANLNAILARRRAKRHP